ncbi:unnamed protein product [Rotaria sordida]|uniref:Uncharacterized protein n=1 Tax=Rotaria sordida TaxID=392033 RepID=A0A816G5X6_9BILA|nr:unnamed protein product [Rotaria sordida]CAF1670076.1 unnamed protein product [Rotaria sordida]
MDLSTSADKKQLKQLMVDSTKKEDIDIVDGAYDDRQHSETIYPYLTLNDLREKIKQRGHNASYVLSEAGYLGYSCSRYVVTRLYTYDQLNA